MLFMYKLETKGDGIKLKKKKRGGRMWRFKDILLLYFPCECLMMPMEKKKKMKMQNNSKWKLA